MGQLIQTFGNSVSGTLKEAMTENDTTLILNEGHGARFPLAYPVSGNEDGYYFIATLFGVNENGREDRWEVVRVTERVGDVLTVERGVEAVGYSPSPTLPSPPDPSPAEEEEEEEAEEAEEAEADGFAVTSWEAGTRIELRVTARTLYEAHLTIDPATLTQDGLLSANDKVKLDGVAAGATRVLPEAGNGLAFDNLTLSMCQAAPEVVGAIKIATDAQIAAGTNTIAAVTPKHIAPFARREEALPLVRGNEANTGAPQYAFDETTGVCSEVPESVQMVAKGNTMLTLSGGRVKASALYLKGKRVAPAPHATSGVIGNCVIRSISGILSGAQYVPSGGTWAYWCDGTYVGVLAGGAKITSVTGGTYKFFFWRIA